MYYPTFCCPTTILLFHDQFQNIYRQNWCTTTKQLSSKQATATFINPNFDQMDVKQIKAFISARGVQVSTYCKTWTYSAS